jgi:hypothetical protein
METIKESLKNDSKSAKYHISPTRIDYVKKHFEGSTVAGSCFYSNVFPNPMELVQTINSMVPHQIIQQENQTQAHLFKAGYAIGICALSDLNALKNPDIQFETRDGISTRFAWVDALPETSHFFVIVEGDHSPFEIITLFPGEYAPPFPHAKQSEKANADSKEFWEKHVLLKKRIST